MTYVALARALPFAFLAIAAGLFCAYTLTPDSSYRATIDQSCDDRIIGHLPASFDSERGATVLDPGMANVADLPDVEFAFGAWRPSLSRVCLVRDPLGGRSLYFTSEAGAWIAFASMPEPLLAIPGVRCRVDVGALPSLLVNGLERDPEATIFSRLLGVGSATK